MIMKKFSGGPAVFRGRMAAELRKVPDIQVVNNPKEGYDIELCFVRSLIEHRRPKITRVDGCYFGRSEERRNRIYREAIVKSSHIIYQSNFSKQMCEAIMNLNQVSTVIHNGINLEEIAKISANPKIVLGSFVACAIWRSNKRPNSLINGFLEANTGRHLYMIGETKKIIQLQNRYRKHKYVHFMGKLEFEQVIAIMKSCQYLLHLTRIDSCPNAVIEGLACGLNVLCTNLGGTREIIKANGIVMDVDSCNLSKKIIQDNGDSIPSRTVANHIHKLMAIKNRPDRPDLDISPVAQKYADLIRKVMN
jgi:glycosyltransferase involved in cell wall biosynthesis